MDDPASSSENARAQRRGTMGRATGLGAGLSLRLSKAPVLPRIGRNLSSSRITRFRVDVDPKFLPTFKQVAVPSVVALESRTFGQLKKTASCVG